MECGGVIKGEAPPNRGGVSHYRKTTPHNMQCAKTMQEHRSMWGPLGGVHPQGGVQMYGGIQTYGGVQMYRGVYKHGGVQQHPQV